MGIKRRTKNRDADLQQAGMQSRCSINKGQQPSLVATQEKLGDLCVSVAGLLDDVPGLDRESSVSQIRSRLGVHRQIAWQVQRLACTPNPIGDVTNVPSDHGMQNILVKAEEAGARPPALDAVREAHSEFQDLVAEYADDRETFSLMVASSDRSNTDVIREKYRRDNYRSLSKILGIKCSCQLALFAMAPSAQSPARLDGVRLDCSHNVWQLHEGARWVLTQPIPQSIGEDNLDIRTGCEHLDPDSQSEFGLPILGRFSSLTPSDVQSLSTDLGTEYHCAWRELGRPGRQTFTTGVYRQALFPAFVDSYDEATNAEINCTVNVRIPAEQLVVDVLIRNDVRMSTRPSAVVYPDHNEPRTAPWPRRNLPLPVSSKVQNIGRAKEARLQHLDSYTELISYAMGKVGWDPADFMVYRYSMSYPLMPSTVFVHWNVPASQEV